MTNFFDINRVENDFNEFINYAESNTSILLYSKKPLFDKYTPVYTITTENLLSYFNELSINGKKCLTVSSSGDQIINLALMGAKKIDCFDYNRITYYIVKLKLAALQSLTYNEFIDYFTTLKEMPNNSLYRLVNENFFSYELYRKIYTYLDDDVKLFFDKLYAKCNYDGMKVKDARVIYNVDDDMAIHNNLYLQNKKIYSKSASLIKKMLKRGISFHEMDIYEIVNLGEQYDIILLSNIFDYIGARKENYTDFIENEVTKILEPSGKIILNYQYGYRQRKDLSYVNNLAVYIKEDDDRYYSEVSSIRELSNREFTLIGVPSVYKESREAGVEDCVYVYKKNKF